MLRILIAYDTTEGQTRKIAQHIAGAIASSGKEVEMIDIRRPSTGFTMESFNAVVICASIHMSKHSRQLSEFVRRHIVRLNAVPSGFFSISLSAAGSEQERADASRFVEDFLTQSGWNPAIKATIAGGLLYRDYGFLKRWMMKKIAREAGKDVGEGEGRTEGVEDASSTPQKGIYRVERGSNSGRRRGGHGCGDQRDAGRAGSRLRAVGAWSAGTRNRTGWGAAWRATWVVSRHQSADRCGPSDSR